MTLETLRLFVHVLAATVWVGGQLTLLGLLPAVRAIGGDAPRLVARRFRRIAWPAFAVLVLTGIWNVAAEAGEDGSEGGGVLVAKVVAVVLSGLAAWLHERAAARVWTAVWGAVGLVASLAALLLGVVLGS